MRIRRREEPWSTHRHDAAKVTRSGMVNGKLAGGMLSIIFTQSSANGTSSSAHSKEHSAWSKFAVRSRRTTLAKEARLRENLRRRLDPPCRRSLDARPPPPLGDAASAPLGKQGSSTPQHLQTSSIPGRSPKAEKPQACTRPGALASASASASSDLILKNGRLWGAVEVGLGARGDRWCCRRFSECR